MASVIIQSTENNPSLNKNHLKTDLNFSPKETQSKECILPPIAENKKGMKTLVLDLDETLIHSCFQNVENTAITLPVIFPYINRYH